MIGKRTTTACALLVLLCGCSSVASPTASTMSFAQMQALNPGVDGEWILAEYPFARDVRRRPDRSLQSMGYWVTDPQGKTRPLMLHFDETGTLLRKQYGGPLVRPPPRSDLDFDVGFG